MTTLDQALTVRTESEVRVDLSNEIAARGGDDQGFPETSTQRKLLDVDAAGISAEETIRADVTRSTSLALLPEIAPENGRDAWIEHAARGRFSLDRDPATAALHVFRLTNSATGVQWTFAPGELRARFGKLDFVNVTKPDILDYSGAGTLAIGGTLDLLFECQTAGTSGNIPANTVTQLVTVYAGVSVSNPAIGSTGRSIYRPARDAETNASLLDRMGSRMGASSAGGSNGSLVEWLHEAFAFAGVTFTITKWLIVDTNPRGPGTTDVYLANATGPATAEEVATAQAYYDKREPSGSGGPPGILVKPSVPRAITITVTVKNSSNLAALADSQAVVTTLNAEAPLGGWILYRTEVIQRLMDVDGTIDLPYLDFENTTFAPGESLVMSANITVIP